MNLRAKLVAQRRLAPRVRQQRRVQQWGQWCVECLRGAIGVTPQDRGQHPCGIEGQIDVSVDRVGQLTEHVDEPRDDPDTGLRATVLGERLERARYHGCEVPREAVRGLRVDERSHLWCDGRCDQGGEPLVERGCEQRFVQSRVKLIRHEGVRLDGPETSSLYESHDRRGPNSRPRDRATGWPAGRSTRSNAAPVPSERTPGTVSFGCGHRRAAERVVPHQT